MVQANFLTTQRTLHQLLIQSDWVPCCESTVCWLHQSNRKAAAYTRTFLIPKLRTHLVSCNHKIKLCALHYFIWDRMIYYACLHITLQTPNTRSITLHLQNAANV